MFFNYFQDLCFENEDFVERIFMLCDSSRNGELGWTEFIFTMKLLYTVRFEDKVNLFFSVVEGGAMTFERLVKVCKMSLGKFSTDSLR